MTPRRRDAAATRQALLDAARERFARVGYDGTTLRDVAGDVGVNLALIKRYFGSKEGLFKAALAGTPQFVTSGSGSRASLVRDLSHQLAADAEPGEHPALLLLRASGNEQVTALRREALESAARRLLDAAGAGPGALLRAELLVALGVGVAVLRSATGVEPLRQATAEELAEPLRVIVDALLPPG